MRKVILNTRDGGYVGTATVPPVEPPYEVLLWGTRLFVRARLPAAAAGLAGGVPVYTEGLGHVLGPDQVDEGPVK